MNEPADRDSLDSILRFLMREADAHQVLAGRYRVMDLIGDLAEAAIVNSCDQLNVRMN